jgi:hypothetical protein
MIRTKEKYMCIVEDCYSTARFGYKNIFNEVDNTNLQYNPCKYSTLRHLYNEGFVLVEKCNVHKEKKVKFNFPIQQQQQHFD